jgi:hypothetical protein
VSPGPEPDPYPGFFAALRIAGLVTGVAQQTRLQTLLLRLVAAGRLPDGEQRWLNHLAPLLCHSADDRQILREMFSEWYPRLYQAIEPQGRPPAATKSALPRPASRPTPIRRRPLRVALLGLAVVLVLAGVVTVGLTVVDWWRTDTAVVPRPMDKPTPKPADTRQLWPAGNGLQGGW